MTDKQIIIDGCNVSGCKYFENADQEMCCELTCCGGCRGINCYYKQLKRKEQECERWKEQLDEMILQSALLPKFFGLTADEITNMLKQLDQLKSENKHLNDLLNQALKDYEKAMQTLTEIKEIAEHCMQQDICTTCDYSDRCYIEDEEIPTYDVCKLLLQKISEVIE